MKKKIAFVVHRYGIEVNGGAEMYCRVMAEKLKDRYDVEVLTTCALEYTTWEDYYPQGLADINGVKVRRFKVDYARNTEEFNKINERIVTSPKRTEQLQNEWVNAQGPTSTALIDYIGQHKDTYSAFLFVTYLYYHTVRGLEEVADKAILIPTAHDEPPIYYSIYEKVFNIPKAIVYLTEEERQFVQRKFKNSHISSKVIGMGIDVPSELNPTDFKKKYGLDKYIIYVGRIDESKGCGELFRYFIKYKDKVGGNIKLVLMGKAAMDIPVHKDIISLGFVSEEDKFNGIKGAELLILPSHYESFSISTLEALAEAIPVVVSGKCEVLKGHVVRGINGLYYTNYDEFELTMQLLLQQDKLRTKMGKNGQEYVNKNYQWSSVLDKFYNMIDYAIEK